MDQEEIQAEQFVLNHRGQLFRYIGEDPLFKNKTGSFEVLEDMNCCAPTQNILFAFNCGPSRKVLLAREVLDSDCFIPA